MKMHYCTVFTIFPFLLLKLVYRELCLCVQYLVVFATPEYKGKFLATKLIVANKLADILTIKINLVETLANLLATINQVTENFPLYMMEPTGRSPIQL